MITGRHFQNAYVTRNVDQAVAQFRELADVRSVLTAEVEIEIWTPQGSGVGVQKVAFLWVEDLNIEMIEPKGGDVLAIYRDALPADDSLEFHHVCHRVDDWGELWRRILRQRFEVVLRGGTPGVLEFCYIDTRPWLGHFTEYVWMASDRWTAIGGR